MIPYTIDISEVIEEILISEEEIKSLGRYILTRVVGDFERAWEKNINAQLTRTREEYKKGIYTNFIDDFNVETGLTPRQSKLAIMLEVGSGPFDMKPGFKKSKKAHNQGTDQWYINIPFRHATPGALLETGFSTVLPQNVYDIAVEKKRPLILSDLPDQTIRERAAIHLNSAADIPPSLRRQATISAQRNQVVIPKYEHKHHIYEGLFRQDIRASEKEKRGGYFTFRRVSEVSDKLSWIHKGFKPKRILFNTFDEFSSKIPNIANKAIDEFLTKKYS